MNSDVIRETGNIVAKADSLGITGINLMYSLILLVVVGYFLYFVVGKLTVVLEKVTDVVKENTTESKHTRDITIRMLEDIDNKVSSIQTVQGNMHLDIKSISTDTRYKCGFKSKVFQNDNDN